MNKTLASITGSTHLVKVKTDLLLLSTTLNQLEGVTKKIKMGTTYKGDAEKDLYALLKAKNLLQSTKERAKIVVRYGSVDGLVNCYVTMQSPTS